MRRKIALIILAAVFFGLAGLAVYQLAVLRDFRPATIVKLALILLTCGIAFARVLSGGTGGRASRRTYDKEYGGILKTAFAQDRSSRKKLSKALDLYNKEQEGKASLLLAKLLSKCRQNADYAAVYTFLGICFDDLGMADDAIGAYEEAVQYDGGISTAWSNLGLLYMEKGRVGDAVGAYRRAIDADGSNPYAHANLAAAYLRAGQIRECIAAAGDALKLKNNLYQAMSTMAIAWQTMGDTERAEEYARLYALNGGDGMALRQRLDSVRAAAIRRGAPSPEEARALLADTARPVLRLRLTNTLPGLTDSKVGGVPYLPRETAPPLDAAGNPLRLLCQIDCRECTYLPDFPHQGLLQFFISPGDGYGLDFGYSTRQNGFRVLYHPAVDLSVTEAEVMFRLPSPGADEAFPVDGVYGLAFEADEEIMSRRDYRLDGVFKEKTGQPFCDLPDELWEEIGDSLDGSGHKMGGYPAFAQEDPRDAGGLDRFDTLLIQLDSECEARSRIMWGDAGVCNFFISREKLRALDFSDVLYNWDCG